MRASSVARPTRCVTIQLNGTGSISRWYYDPSGDPQYVEWPRGVKQIASDEKAVKNTFPRGNEMSP